MSILTNCAHKYWDIYEVAQNKSPERIGSYRFNKNGSCYFLKWYKSDNKRAFFVDGDYFRDVTWKFVDSNVIDINLAKYDIIHFSNDSIILSLKYDKTIDKLMPSPDQNDAYEFDD